jgi:hypothetical protein
MLQNFLGSYIVLSLLATIVIWRALAASKRADVADSEESPHTKDALVRMNHPNRKLISLQVDRRKRTGGYLDRMLSFWKEIERDS